MSAPMLTIHNRHPAACGIPSACSTEAADLSAFGSMLAYPRGPDAVAGYISHYAGTDPAMIMFLLVVLFVIVGDFIDAVPAIIILMPIITKLTKVGNINPVHMGVEVRGGAVLPRDAPIVPAVHRLLPHHRVHGAVPRRGAVAAEMAVAAIGRLFPQPQRHRVRLPEIADPPRMPRYDLGP